MDDEGDDAWHASKAGREKGQGIRLGVSFMLNISFATTGGATLYTRSWEMYKFLYVFFLPPLNLVPDKLDPPQPFPPFLRRLGHVLTEPIHVLGPKHLQFLPHLIVFRH